MSEAAVRKLARVVEQEIERARQELARLDARCETLTAQLARASAEGARETALGWNMPDGPRLVAAYLSGLASQREGWRWERSALREQQLECRATLQRHEIEHKRLERLGERLAQRRREEENRRETLVLDGLAVLRHAARQRGVAS